MNLLELFSGTGSVGNVASKVGYNVISVDICDKLSCPTHKADILKWNYKIYPKGYFHVIWASPPCTEFSRAKTKGVRDLVYANKLVKKALEIINYFKPKYWALENPVGLLRYSPSMRHLDNYRKTLSYCKYGYIYRKDTDIWTNINVTPKLCRKHSYCKNAKMNNGIHPATVQQGTSAVVGQSSTSKLNQRYSVPTRLIKDILSKCN